MSDKDNKFINVSLTPNELSALINTLSVAKAVFQNSAEVSINNNDRETFDKLIARVNTCSIFIDRLVRNVEIGEPNSKTQH